MPPLRGASRTLIVPNGRAVRNNTLRTRESLVRLKTDYKIVDSSGGKLHSGHVIGESYVVVDPNFQTSDRQALSEAGGASGSNAGLTKFPTAGDHHQL